MNFVLGDFLEDLHTIAIQLKIAVVSELDIVLILVIEDNPGLE